MGLLRSAAKLAFATADLFLPSPRGPRILIYHNVGVDAGRQMEVTVEDFAWQMSWLADNREVVDLETAITRWEEPNASHLVVLTFDDGYIDTFTRAFPIISELGLPFTLYLSTEMIEDGDDEALTWRQIESMMETGLVTIGSHTHRHRDLRLTDGQGALEEMSRADEIIERRLDVKSMHFAYPWGYWSENGDLLVRQRYKSAVLGAPYRPGSNSDMHQIHRFPVQLSDRRMWFKRRLRGGLLLEERARRWLRGYRGP